MTELKTFISWLERQNIHFKGNHEEEHTDISVEAGYAGFVSVLTFDKEGKFIKIEASE